MARPDSPEMKPYRDTNKIEIAGQLGQNPEIVALTSGRIIVTGHWPLIGTT